jgi:hypothetical protein
MNGDYVPIVGGSAIAGITAVQYNRFCNFCTSVMWIFPS